MQFYHNTPYTEDQYANEDQLHAACYLWFHNNPAMREHRQMLFHISQKSKNAIEGAKHRNMGVIRGVADFGLALHGARMAFIELKFVPRPERGLRTGHQLPEQQSFEVKVLLRGHSYYLVNSLAAFQHLVLALLA